MEQRKRPDSQILKNTLSKLTMKIKTGIYLSAMLVIRLFMETEFGKLLKRRQLVMMELAKDITS